MPSNSEQPGGAGEAGVATSMARSRAPTPIRSAIVHPVPDEEPRRSLLEVEPFIHPFPVYVRRPEPHFLRSAP